MVSSTRGTNGADIFIRNFANDNSSVFTDGAMSMAEVAKLSVGLFDPCAANGHTPGDSATCMTAQICTVCEEVLVEALGHTAGERVDVLDPTCTEEGRWETKCEVCKDILEYGAIDALGHDYGEFKVLKSNDTRQFRICKTCRSVDVQDRLVGEILYSRAADIMLNGLTTDQLHLSANNRATLTLVLPGMDRFEPIVLSTNANNRNIEGVVPLSDGYYLRFDIKGNGSNIKVFEIIYRG
jgi:hypothetical protein